MSNDINLTTKACFIKKNFGANKQIEITVYPDYEEFFNRSYDIKVDSNILQHNVDINLGGNKCEFTMGEAIELHKVLGEIIDQTMANLA